MLRATGYIKKIERELILGTTRSGREERVRLKICRRTPGRDDPEPIRFAVDEDGILTAIIDGADAAAFELGQEVSLDLAPQPAARREKDPLTSARLADTDAAAREAMGHVRETFR